jgi:hypothetical protein
MSKTFRPWKIEEPLLLPVTVADFVAESHLARFVLSVVRDEVDLGKITGTYGSELGHPLRQSGQAPRRRLDESYTQSDLSASRLAA